MNFLTAIFISFIFAGQSIASDVKITTPAPGSALYKELLNAMRPAVEFELNTSVKFDVLAMNVKGNWAFLALQAKQADGSPIDFMTTIFESPTSDMPNARTLVLLKKVAARWYVIRQQTGQLYGLWTDEAGYFVKDFDLFRSEKFDVN